MLAKNWMSAKDNARSLPVTPFIGRHAALLPSLAPVEEAEFVAG